jgi:hypothetical protein
MGNTKNTIGLFIIVSVLIFTIAGCVHYLEQETPAGTVPPVSSPKNQQSLQEAPVITNAPSGDSEKRGEAGIQSTQGTIERFAKLYATEKSPRIAIFLNRSLSDDVKEWELDTGPLIIDEKTKTEKVSRRGKEATEKEVAVVGFVKEKNEERPLSPEERWIWSFEDGFMQPFLQAKTKLVDRSVIIRLTAAQTQKESALQPLAVKEIETSALKGYSDILVEILITRSPSSLYGYEFKAQAKDIKNGTIIANVTSLRWKAKSHPAQVVNVSSEGYKVTNEVKLPAVADVATDLATDLMNALIRSWEK